MLSSLKETGRMRLVYFVAIIIIVLLGLLSRRFATHLPAFINTYLGDALWAMMIYGIVCTFFPHWKPTKIFIISLLFCYAIELSQLYHEPWIDSVRHTRIGGLILGFGFLWTDIIAYTMGIIIAGLVDQLFCRSTLHLSAH